MTQDNSTDDTLPDGSGSSPAGGDAAVDSGLTLAEINTALGKDFKDKTTALKALKDTQSFVGKRKEDIEAEVRASIQNGGNANAPQGNTALESTVKSLQDQLFYTNNPQYKEYADVISSMGENPAEVVETPAFKKVFEKAQVADKVNATRSVVASNARIAEQKTHTQNAIATANATRSTEAVANVLAGAVREALES